MTKSWSDIPSPFGEDKPVAPVSEIAEMAENAAHTLAPRLDSAVIVTTEGKELAVLVDQSSRTVYPKRVQD